MARKKKPEIVEPSSDEIGNQQVRLPNDLLKMIGEMVGTKKGAAGRYIEKRLRPIVTLEHKEWAIKAVEAHGLSVRE